MKVFEVANTIDIVLEYPFLEDAGFDPIKWFLRPALDKDQRDARQTFFGLAEKEREAKQFEYNVDFLATLSEKAPTGLPRFEYTEGSLAEAIRSFLTAASDDPVIVKQAEDAQTEYFRRTQPKVFFRSV
jgi:hypothetical protein